MRRLAEALEMDEGGAGAAEAGHALDSYFATGRVGRHTLVLAAFVYESILPNGW